MPRRSPLLYPSCGKRPRARDEQRRPRATCGRAVCSKIARSKFIGRVNSQRRAQQRRLATLKRPAAARRSTAAAGGAARACAAVLGPSRAAGRATFPARERVPLALFRRCLPRPAYLRRLFGREGSARFHVRVSFREPTEQEWQRVAFADEALTLTHRGIRGASASAALKGDATLSVRTGGRYGSGCYFAADPLLPLAYARETRDQARHVVDGAPRVVLICACALGETRLVGAERPGPMSAGQTSVASSPSGCVPGFELCVGNPSHRCLIIGIATVELLSGSFHHVAAQSKCTAGEPDPAGPHVIATRRRRRRRDNSRSSDRDRRDKGTIARRAPGVSVAYEPSEPGLRPGADEGSQSSTGALYYHNRVTGQTRWDHPSPPEVEPPAAQRVVPGGVPPQDSEGWAAWWFNPVTGAACNEKPSEISAWTAEVTSLSDALERAAPTAEQAAQAKAEVMALRRFQHRSELNAAAGAWHNRARELVGDSTDGRVSTAAVFSAKCHSQADLYKLVQAMGVEVTVAPEKGKPALAPAPLAIPRGCTNQPGVEITWKVSPTTKITVQIESKRLGKIVAKGRRGAFETRLEELLLFLGDPIDVESVLRWASQTKRRTEAAAALRDAIALADMAPTLSPGIRQHLGAVADPSWALCTAVSTLVRREAVPALTTKAAKSTAVTSPFVGGIFQSGEPGRCAVPPLLNDSARSHLTLAVLNPGRSGFLHLSSDLILEWRLEAVAHALDDRGVDLCILPGSRFPAGALLPKGSPFLWLGPESAAWGTVGIFVRPELERATRPIHDFSSSREQWYELWSDGQVDAPTCIICAMYPVHGGDLDTWVSIVAHAGVLRAKFPRARLLVGGDGNLHLDYVVSHGAGCRRLRCHQRSKDKLIQEWLDSAGSRAFNPPSPTHVSGTCIDLFLGSRHDPLPAHVVDEFVGLSDHRLVLIDVPCRATAQNSAGFGRVAWTSGEEWETGLREVASTLQALATAIETVGTSQWLRPPWYGGGATRLQRRAVLNVAAWARDTIYAMVGHASSATRTTGVASRSRDTSRRPPLDPSPYPSHEAFREAASAAAWQERRKAVHRYLDIRETNAGAAERFLSGFFRSTAKFDIQLVDSITGHALSTSGMIDAIRDDVYSRAHNDFPQCPEARDSLAQAVTAIRRSGAEAGPLYPERPCADHEVEAALSLLKPGKRTVHLCNAALRVQVEEGFRLTRALLNLGRALCVTARPWSLRHFAPIRKSGPATVRKIKSLRPISLTTDMASVQDAAWIARNGPLIEAYCGPSQQGGVGDTVSLVIALTMNAQLRAAQDLPTWWAVADNKWAFDVASVNGMLCGVFEAGVRGSDWLLLDDVLAQDHQAVGLHNLLSPVFAVGRGAAQGRRFSVHIFNAQLKALPVEIAAAVPGGCATVAPRLARQAMAAAGEANPPATEAAMPDRAFPAAAMLHEVPRVAATESPPWPRAEAALAARLSAVPALADRAAVVELAGELHMPPAQFVDDITVACPSIGAVRAVLSPEDESACSRYARTFKSFFSREKSKTCVLPVLGAPPPSLAGCPEVDRKVLLGILADSDLTFYPLLRGIVAVGHSCFSKLLYAAESGGFSIPVAAAQVPARVESVVLYAAPLLAAVPGAESTMNKLQVTWGRRLLGCHKGPPIRHAVVVAQCGWPMRLGTRFLEKALMARARLMVLPGDHPGALMLRAARSLATPTWESAAVALAQRLAPPPQDLEGHPLFPAALLDEARVSSAARKAILKSCRLE
ncbi:unnamed protein product, partial [Prorocentrum cordatum]